MGRRTREGETAALLRALAAAAACARCMRTDAASIPSAAGRDARHHPALTLVFLGDTPAAGGSTCIGAGAQPSMASLTSRSTLDRVGAGAHAILVGTVVGCRAWPLGARARRITLEERAFAPM